MHGYSTGYSEGPVFLGQGAKCLRPLWTSYQERATHADAPEPGLLAVFLASAGILGIGEDAAMRRSALVSVLCDQAREGERKGRAAVDLTFNGNCPAMRHHGFPH
jgi:hypothetical protein